MTWAPLYANYEHGRATNLPPGGHPGLWFERLFNQYDQDWTVGDTGKRDFLRSLVGHRADSNTGFVGDDHLIERAILRTRRLAECLQGRHFTLESSWHFVTGLGNEHPVENGLTWHPTLGTPYLPGSAVKGLARTWLELHDYDEELRYRLFGSDDKDPLTSGEFRAGEIIFFDALPVQQVEIVIDIMTPHMGSWYQDGGTRPGDADTTPADWHAPTPVPFLAARQIALDFKLAPRTPAARDLLPLACEALEAALRNLGAGAKTAAGYGSFGDPGSRTSARLEQIVRSEAAHREASELASLSAEARQLHDLKTLAERPENQAVQSAAAFYEKLEGTLREASNWPPEAQQDLARFARQYLKAFGSKKKKKALAPLIEPLETQ